jgi:hypothetical protein
MLEIAGGILLAVLVVAFWPLVWRLACAAAVLAAITMFVALIWTGN